jgi:ankyrin repeat protein
LVNGADPNTQDDHHKSLLYYAAKNRNLAMIEVLLSHPSINTTKIADNTQGISDGSGSPFHVALQRGYPEIAKRILAVNNVDVLSSLRSAIEKNNVDMVAHIFSMDIPAQYFEEALFAAARWDRVEIMSIVLSHDVNINCSLKFGSTPLYVAVAHGNLAALQFLVKHGATMNITLDNGQAPLYKAIQERYVNVARFLIDQGADIHITGGYKHYSLLVAAFDNYNEKKCIPLMQLIMRKGIDVNKKNIVSGNVALHYAVIGRCVEVVRLLLEHPDIKVNELNNYNKTPLDSVCFSHGYEEDENGIINSGSALIKELLIAHGGKTFAQLKEIKMQNDGK